MNIERRKFLQKMFAVCSAGVARNLAVGVTAVAASTDVVAGATAAAAVAAAPIALGVRGQILEVIVRQALAGAPWQVICAAPMQVNGITVKEVEAEIERRRSQKHDERLSQGCSCCDCLNKRQHARVQFSKAVAEIKHSPVSPCACVSCRLAIEEMIEKHRIAYGAPGGLLYPDVRLSIRKKPTVG